MPGRCFKPNPIKKVAPEISVDEAPTRKRRKAAKVKTASAKPIKSTGKELISSAIAARILRSSSKCFDTRRAFAPAYPARFAASSPRVGPGPVVEAELERYGPYAADYIRARPGLTGLWQVSGRNNISYAQRIALDRFYVRRWSLFLDILILLRTVPALLRPDETA